MKNFWAKFVKLSEIFSYLHRKVAGRLHVRNIKEDRSPKKDKNQLSGCGGSCFGEKRLAVISIIM